MIRMTVMTKAKPVKRYYLGYDEKKKRVFGVLFSATNAELNERLEMFAESNLVPVAMDNNTANRSALRKVLDEMNKEVAATEKKKKKRREVA